MAVGSTLNYFRRFAKTEVKVFRYCMYVFNVCIILNNISPFINFFPHLPNFAFV